MDIRDLKPHTYEHGRGLRDALDASTDSLRAFAGTSFVEGHEEVAKALREVLHQFMDAREKVVREWTDKWPEPPPIILDEFDAALAAEHGGTGVPPKPVRTKAPRRPTRR